MAAHVTPRQAALTLLNEAITAIDACQEPNIATHEVTGLLLQAREQLTRKHWPETVAKFAPDAKYQSWVLARLADQLLDGRQ
jgi:hypothetical protein